MSEQNKLKAFLNYKKVRSYLILARPVHIIPHKSSKICYLFSGFINRPIPLRNSVYRSVPTPPPVPHIPTFRGWYFFAYRFGFMRVCGECCGLWRRGFRALKVRVLSLGADSLCESVPVIWVEVREWFFLNL